MDKKELQELKEIEKVEKLEREIEESIKSLENVSSFNSALFFGLVIGITTNIVATIFYELYLRELSYSAQITITIIFLVVIPILIAFWFKSHNKVKASKERLKIHLENVREHKKTIKNTGKR